MSILHGITSYILFLCLAHSLLPTFACNHTLLSISQVKSLQQSPQLLPLPSPSTIDHHCRTRWPSIASDQFTAINQRGRPPFAITRRRLSTTPLVQRPPSTMNNRRHPPWPSVAAEDDTPPSITADNCNGDFAGRRCDPTKPSRSIAAEDRRFPSSLSPLTFATLKDFRKVASHANRSDW
jgi:hypothetical protein